MRSKNLKFIFRNLQSAIRIGVRVDTLEGWHIIRMGP